MIGGGKEGREGRCLPLSFLSRSSLPHSAGPRCLRNFPKIPSPSPSTESRVSGDSVEGRDVEGGRGRRTETDDAREGDVDDSDNRYLPPRPQKIPSSSPSSESRVSGDSVEGRDVEGGRGREL